MLALGADFSNPLLWAILIGWILSVTVHEFAHGLAAHLGGDYTIAERGGVTLNPLQYVDPLGSLIFPAIILLIGGIPLPGGVNYIRKDLLRGRHWEVIVSAAGPLSNFILYIIFSLMLDPRLGWVPAGLPVDQWSTAQTWVGAMAYLQLLAVLLNLLPIPPLDGFQMISPFLPAHIEQKLLTPPISTLCFFGYFMLLFTPLFWLQILKSGYAVHRHMGFDVDFLSIYRAFYRCF